MDLPSGPPRIKRQKTGLGDVDAGAAVGSWRDSFLIPRQEATTQQQHQQQQQEGLLGLDGTAKEVVYLAGNSLGLQPKSVKREVVAELEKWAHSGVEGHFTGDKPWVAVGEQCRASMARIVGANESEVVIMNSLTVNLHLLMVSFYVPTSTRFKIIMEDKAFPSDQYAVESQIRFHGFDPASALIRVSPRLGEDCIQTKDILDLIKLHGEELSLVLFSGVHYYTGQAFDIPSITKAAHDANCIAGFDLAHAAGNVLLHLHEWEVDFACWCSYKYLNSGPGGIGAAFIHEKHHPGASSSSSSASDGSKTKRFCGWWGHEKTTRFQMKDGFTPAHDASVWQLSNPPVLQIAALRASMDLFDQATMPELQRLSVHLTGHLEQLIHTSLPENWGRIITPKIERGCQLSLVFNNCDVDKVHEELGKRGVICDRRDMCIRVAPVPLYNTLQDVEIFVSTLSDILAFGNSE